MLFTVDLLVPKGTTAANPATEEIALVKGQLRRLDVVFPPGPASLVYVTVSDALHQIMPANQDQDVNGDGQTVTSIMEYDLQRPYILTFRGWSPEARYDHTITFNLDVAPAGKDSWGDFLATVFGGSQGVLRGR